MLQQLGADRMNWAAVQLDEAIALWELMTNRDFTNQWDGMIFRFVLYLSTVYPSSHIPALWHLYASNLRTRALATLQQVIAVAGANRTSRLQGLINTLLAAGGQHGSNVKRAVDYDNISMMATILPPYDPSAAVQWAYGGDFSLREGLTWDMGWTANITFER